MGFLLCLEASNHTPFPLPFILSLKTQCGNHLLQEVSLERLVRHIYKAIHHAPDAYHHTLGSLAILSLPVDCVERQGSRLCGISAMIL